MSRGNFEPVDERSGVAEKHREAALRGKKGKKAKGPYASYKGINKVIAEMLTENTGINMLDSGGAAGRGWQQRQGRDFKKEDAVIVEAYESGDEVMVMFNLFHYLTTYLELDNNCKKLQKRFDKFARSPEQEDEPWPVSMEEFAIKINEEPSMLEYIGSVNTYNYDNILSGVIQYESFFYDGGHYMLMQTHNGADVRGGYSNPRVFKIADSDYFIMAQNAVSAWTEDYTWESDDGGNHWQTGYTSSGEEFEDVPELEFDVRGDKVYLKDTNSEIDFSVMESY